MLPTETVEMAVRDGEMRGPSPVDARRNGEEHPPESAVEEKVLKVLVGIPLKGHTPPLSYHDRMMLWHYLGYREATEEATHKTPRYKFALGAIGEMLIQYARERLVESALELNCDYLFMVDDDMLSPPDLFYRLAAHDKDIVAALAFTRNPDHKPVIYETMESGFDQATGIKYGGFTRFVNNYPKNQLVECDAVGFGAVLIKTEVFRNVKRPWFFGMEGTGEDITFCVKAKKAGFRVWMDTSIKLGHLGAPTIITEEYSEAWNKMTDDQREKLYGRFRKYEVEAVS